MSDDSSETTQSFCEQAMKHISSSLPQALTGDSEQKSNCAAKFAAHSHKPRLVVDCTPGDKPALNALGEARLEGLHTHTHTNTQNLRAPLAA